MSPRKFLIMIAVALCTFAFSASAQMMQAPELVTNQDALDAYLQSDGERSAPREVINQPYHPMMGSDAMFGFGFGSGPFFMILWWALIIAGIVALVKWISGAEAPRDMSGTARSALDILKERYAKGEIDKSEFEEKKKDLL